MVYNIEVIGFNDVSGSVPEFITNIGNANLYFFEFFLNKKSFQETYKKLNNRNAIYYSTEDKYVKEINTHLKNTIKTTINPTMLKIIYRTKHNYEFAYPIGCLPRNDLDADQERYIRSCEITNQLIDKIDSINPLESITTNFEIKVLTGEPHRLFIKHFLEKKGFNIKSISYTLDYLKTNKETQYVLTDILKAEHEKIIHF
jgi:hypothetical protein